MKLNTRYTYEELLKALTQAEKAQSSEDKVVSYKTSGTIGHHLGDTVVITRTEGNMFYGVFPRWGHQFTIQREEYQVKMINGQKVVIV